jgi:hypothetical protein
MAAAMRPLPARQGVRHTRARGSGIRARSERDGRRPGVLPARRIDQGDELVHLQKRPRGPRRPDPHPPPAGRIALDVLVFDRLVEDCGERLGQLLEREAKRP